MSFLSFLKKRKAAIDERPPVETEHPSHNNEPTAKQVFQEPKLLASWIKEHYLDSMPLSRDYQLLPDSEARADLEITPEQRDRCLREYSVLRIAGTSLFVKQHYEDSFWLQYTDQVSLYLFEHIQTEHFETTRATVREALEQYVQAGDAKDPDQISTAYMRRVYDDNPNYIRMKVAGIGMLANDTLISSYDVLRDAYCQVKYGMSYEPLRALDAAMQKTDSNAST